MKTIRTSTLSVIAAALVAAIALVATRNFALPVAGLFEIAASLIAIVGLLAITGNELASNSVAQGVKLAVAARPAAKPAGVRAVRTTVTRVPHPAPLMRPVAIRRREPALVEAA